MSTQIRSKTAIIIPCFNVADHIVDVIASIPREFAMIIAVDDASRDSTVARIEASNDPRVVLIRRAQNGGVGAAMKTGYDEALRRGAGVCVKMDGDGQMHASDLPRLLDPLEEGDCDYSKGNRFVDLPALQAMPRVRLAGNAFLSFVGKAASGYWNVLDVTNGFTAVRSSVLRRMNLQRLNDRYFFEISMLIELNLLGARLADVTMPARYGDERSSLRISRVALTFPFLLIRGVLRRFYWRYLVSDFGVVAISLLLAIPLLLFGIVFGGIEWWQSIRTGRPASAGTVILAALPIILGFQLFLTALVLDVLGSQVLKVNPMPAEEEPERQ